MPYNPGGIFSLVASYFANPGTTIRTEQHNPPLEDIASALSSVLIRDGRAPMTGPLNMNGFAINNVVAGNTPSSVATLAQSMPIGAVIEFAGNNAPTGWALCYGQAISRSTYAALFAIVGTTYGAGDGSTTFNLPDLRGRVVAGRDDMGGTAAARLTPGYLGTPAILGASGGLQYHQITQSQLPAIAPTFSGASSTVSGNTTLGGIPYNVSGFSEVNPGGGRFALTSTPPTGFIPISGSVIPQGTISNLGTGAFMPLVQPTFILNKIMRVSYDG